jgi:hypothetical protein
MEINKNRGSIGYERWFCKNNINFETDGYNISLGSGRGGFQMNRKGSLFINSSILVLMILTIAPLNGAADGAGRIVLDRTMVQDGLRNLTNLSNDRSVNGHVSSSDENGTIVKVYRVHVPREGFHSMNDLYIKLRRTSEDGQIYLDTYDTDLTRLGNRYSIDLSNDTSDSIRSDSIRIEYKDVKEDYLYLVVYGSGDYTIFSDEIINPIFSGTIIIVLMIFGFLIFLVAMVFYFIYPKVHAKKKMLKEQMSGKRDKKEMAQYIQEEQQSNRLTKIVKIIYIISSDLIFLSWIGMASVTNIAKNDQLLFSIILGLSFGSMLAFVGIMISASGIWKIKKEEIETFLKTDRVINVTNKNAKPFKETVYTVGRLSFMVPLIILINLYLIYAILHIIDGFSVNYICGIVWIVLVFVIIISEVFIFYVSYRSIIVSVDCEKGRLRYSNGVLSKIEIGSEQIIQMRPVPTTISLDLFPGRKKVNGKWIKVRTGVAIVLKDGKVKTIMTSRPLDVIALLQK